MNKRRRVFFVKTHRWYVERFVWLIAGTDILVSSILTAWYSPDWAYLILIAGICSIIVALTGFCIVGNILYLLGAKPMLQESAGSRGKRSSIFYFMQTDKWFLERYIYFIVGVNLCLSSLLARFYSPYWLIFTSFVGTASIVFSFTGYCIMANLLYRLGAEPRLGRELP
jgi:hypothetical protein